MTGVAAVATGVAVASGLAGSQDVVPPAAAEVGAGAEAITMSAAQREARAEQPLVSRSDRRGKVDRTKAAALSPEQGHVLSRSEDISEQDPKTIARALLPQYGYTDTEFICLDALYVSESNWRVDADNPTSSAYGIPQALTQTHNLPEGYMTSAEVQIRWGLDYIKSRYGTPCNAWEFKQGHNWY